MVNIALLLLAAFFFFYTFAFLATVASHKDEASTTGWMVALLSWFLFALIVGYLIFQVKL